MSHPFCDGELLSWTGSVTFFDEIPARVALLQVQAGDLRDEDEGDKNA